MGQTDGQPRNEELDSEPTDDTERWEVHSGDDCDLGQKGLAIVTSAPVMCFAIGAMIREL